jgi:hypothetical protein
MSGDNSNRSAGIVPAEKLDKFVADDTSVPVRSPTPGMILDEDELKKHAQTVKENENIIVSLRELEDKKRLELSEIAVRREEILARALDFREGVLLKHLRLKRRERELSAHSGQLLKALKTEEFRVNKLTSTITKMQRQRKQMLSRISEPAWAVPHHYHMTAIEHAMGHTQPHVLDVGGMIRGHLRIFAMSNATIRFVKNANHVLSKAKSGRSKVSEQIKKVYRQLRVVRKEIKEVESILDALQQRLGRRPQLQKLHGRVKAEEQRSVSLDDIRNSGPAGSPEPDIDPDTHIDADVDTKTEAEALDSMKLALEDVSNLVSEDEIKRPPSPGQLAFVVDAHMPPATSTAAAVNDTDADSKSSSTPPLKSDNRQIPSSSAPTTPKGTRPAHGSGSMPRSHLSRGRPAGRRPGTAPMRSHARSAASYRNIKMKFFQALNLTPPEMKDSGMVHSGGAPQPGRPPLENAAMRRGVSGINVLPKPNIFRTVSTPRQDSADESETSTDATAPDTPSKSTQSPRATAVPSPRTIADDDVAADWELFNQLMNELDPLNKARTEVTDELNATLQSRENVVQEKNDSQRALELHYTAIESGVTVKPGDELSPASSVTE